MPIYLPMPRRAPRGPDGQGWNRIHIYPVGNDECALRPTDAATLMESYNTWRASYGGFGACITDGGDCPNCPLFERYTAERPSAQLGFGDRVLFRIWPKTGQPMLMNKPEQGWGSTAEYWTWDRIAMIKGWGWDGFFRDRDSEGFWLRRSVDNPAPQARDARVIEAGLDRPRTTEGD